MEWLVIGVIALAVLTVLALPILLLWSQISVTRSTWKLAKSTKREAEQIRKQTGQG